MKLRRIFLLVQLIKHVKNVGTKSMHSKRKRKSIGDEESIIYKECWYKDERLKWLLICGLLKLPSNHGWKASHHTLITL